MTKQYKLSDDKFISDKQFWFLVKNLIPQVDYSDTDLLQFGEEFFAVGDILEHQMVPSETKPGQNRREYLHLRGISQKAAGTLIDYLKTCPKKGSNNSPVKTEPTVESNKPVGFGSIKPRS